MVAVALVTGTLFRKPVRRTSSKGTDYVTCTVKDMYGEEAVWWHVVCFSEEGCEELLALGDGDAVSARGQMSAEIYTKDGQPRVSLKLIAARVLSARREKRQKRDKPAAPASNGREFNDDIPF